MRQVLVDTQNKQIDTSNRSTVLAPKSILDTASKGPCNDSMGGVKKKERFRHRIRLIFESERAKKLFRETVERMGGG